jgi:hypothetical protein
LQRLVDLLIQKGVVLAPAPPEATPAELVQCEFCDYVRQERALTSTTQACYTAFVGEFLAERFALGQSTALCSVPPTL